MSEKGKPVREHGKLANLVAVGSWFKAPFKNALCQRPHARREARGRGRQGRMGKDMGRV